MALPRFCANFSANVVCNVTLRYALLRIIFVLTAFLLIEELVSNGYDVKTLVIMLVIFGHYLLSALGLNYLPALLDVGLASAEIALLPPHHVTIRLSPQSYLLGASLKWIISLFIVLHALLRVADVLLSLYNRSSLWTRYDITSLGARTGANESRVARIMDIVVGRPLWREQFTGETIWITIFRGSLAWCIIIAMAMFALYNVVVEPIWTTGVIPLKIFRSPTTSMPMDFSGTVPTVWNVVVARPRHLTGDPDQDNNSDFSSAVNVRPFWDDWNEDNTKEPPCGFAPEKTYQIHKPKSNETWDINTFHCPSRVSIPKEKELSFTLPAAHHDTRPNLLVTVNFTALNISSQSLQNIRGNSVQIMLGFTNNTIDVVNRTMPTTLLPGVNIVAAANLFIFQRFRNAHVSVIGLFDYYESFQVSEISHISPDPEASRSTFITPSPNISTMRIFLQNDFTDWRITQDSQEKSILKGFSVVGGLWAFFGGFFAWLFGKSMMQILSGSKPITIFGPMAAFQKEKIREGYKKKYPYIFDETKVNHDLLRFIADEFADLKMLVDTSTRTIQATEDDSMEGEPQSPGPCRPTSSMISGRSGETEFSPSAYEMC